MENAKNKILLINGNTKISILAGLEREEYEIAVCESRQQAWGFVYPIRPDFIILHLPHLSRKDVYALQECLALADGVPVIVATGTSRIADFTEKLGRFVPRFLSLPLKPNAVRDALHGLESEWRKQFQSLRCQRSTGRPVPAVRRKKRRRGEHRMVKEKEKALMLADLIASGEILSCLTVNEVTEELRALFRNVDADTQKEVVERICSVLN